MKKHTLIAVLTAAAITLSLAGCGSKAPAEAENESGAGGTTAYESVIGDTAVEPVEEAGTANTEIIEEGQNPIMNFTGAYSDKGGEYSLYLGASDAYDGVYLTIGHMQQDKYVIYEAVGSIKENVVTYKDCIAYEPVPDANAENGVAYTTLYEDGTGTIVIEQDGTVTWKDDKNNEGEGLVFEWDQQLNEKMSQMMTNGQ